MARIIGLPVAALLLAAMLFTLSACAAGGPSGTSPAVSDPPAPVQSDPPAPTQSDPPAPVQSDPPAPVQSEPPAPTQPEPSAPVQSEPPAPVQSDPPAPVQSDLPDAVQSVLPSASVPVAEGEDVGNDWFADAVFLGDSRTDGLRLYSGIKGATFICHAGLSVFTVDKNACIKEPDGTKITAMDALGKQQWAKVYLMLGINELGYSTASFKRAYTEVVEEIKLLQPGAAIYLQTLIPVNEPIAYKNGTNAAINNEKLKEFNGAITQVAQDQGVSLVDVDTPFWSPEGCLAAENTGDGVHLTRTGYIAWYAYLRTHTGSGTPSAPMPEPWQEVTFPPPQASPDPWDTGAATWGTDPGTSPWDTGTGTAPGDTNSGTPPWDTGTGAAPGDANAGAAWGTDTETATWDANTGAAP